MLITGKALGKTKKTWLYNIIMALLTFHFVCFTWIFFKAADFDTAMIMIYQIAHDFSFSFWMPFFNNYQTVLYIMALAFLLHMIPDKFPDYIINRFKRVPLIAYLVIFFAFVLLYGYFKAAEPVMPIYLQF